MTAEETLKMISKQWCDFEDLKSLSQLGETNTVRLRKKIREELEKKGYILPKHLLPMVEVVKYLRIDIQYLEERVKRGDELEII